MEVAPAVMHSAAYYCADCGLAVIVLPDSEPIKACSCDASIVANLHASLFGEGGIK